MGLLAMERDECRRRERSGKPGGERRVGREGGRDTPGCREHAELGGKGCRMLEGTASRKMSATLSANIVEISASPLVSHCRPLHASIPNLLHSY